MGIALRTVRDGTRNATAQATYAQAIVCSELLNGLICMTSSERRRPWAIMPRTQRSAKRERTCLQYRQPALPPSRRFPMANGTAAPLMKMKSGMMMSQRVKPPQAWLNWRMSASGRSNALSSA